MQKLKNRFLQLTVFQKIFIVYTLGFGVLAASSLALPTDILAYYGLCLWCMFFLIFLLEQALHTANLTFGVLLKKQSRPWLWCFLAGVCVCAAFYIANIFLRQTVTVWDDVRYFLMSEESLSPYALNFAWGIKDLVFSIWYKDYNKFLLLFTTLPQLLFGGGLNGFLGAIFISGTLPFLCVFSIIGYKILKKQNIVTLPTFFICCLLTAVLPFIHTTALNGMPDIMGLYFAGLCILFAMEEDFAAPRKGNLALCALCSLLVFVTRRWYLIWLVGFYAAWYFIVLFKAYKNKNLPIVFKNIFYYTAATALFFLVTLLPYFIKIVQANYSSSYTAWKDGGILYELGILASRLGWFIPLLCLAGFVFTLKNKTLRSLALGGVISSLIILFAFNRIQSMAKQHVLLLCPAILILLFLAVTLLNKIARGKKLCLGVSYALCAVLLFNGVLPLTPLYGILLPGMSIAPEVRKDYKQLGSLATFTAENCSPDAMMYVIAGSWHFNPDYVRFYGLPQSRLDTCVCTEASVDLSLGFNTQLFDAAYVVTTDPIQQARYKLQDQFTLTIPTNAITHVASVSKNFIFVQAIQLDGFTANIYKRVAPADYAEVSYYLEEFSSIYPNLPHLYADRITEYLDFHNLQKAS
ncbi:MAG: hypothetical protein PHG02_05740 [Oscillospiraceae bacterium]|nr:hypothetical protein [Oscillospiraceae bacterium]